MGTGEGIVRQIYASAVTHRDVSVSLEANPWKEPNVPPFLSVAPFLVFLSSGRGDVRDLRGLVLLYTLPMSQLDVRGEKSG